MDVLLFIIAAVGIVTTLLFLVPPVALIWLKWYNWLYNKFGANK